MKVARRGVLGTALLALALALAGAGAAGASVPAESWYWSMAASGGSPATLVLATNAGLLLSRDGGHSWKATGPAGVEMTSLARLGSTLLAGGVRRPASASPIVQSGGVYAVPPGSGVLAESSDGGSRWTVVHPRGLPGAAIQALSSDPAGSALYALLSGGALYRSDDGAQSFSRVAATVGGPPWALAASAAGLVAGNMTSGNFLHTGGAWQRTPFTDGRGGSMVMEYAAEPGAPGHLLMTSYGVESSPNGGRSWTVALKSTVMFGPVAWAVGTRGEAFAVGFDHSLWRSADGGRHWSQVT